MLIAGLTVRFQCRHELGHGLSVTSTCPETQVFPEGTRDQDVTRECLPSLTSGHPVPPTGNPLSSRYQTFAAQDLPAQHPARMQWAA